MDPNQKKVVRAVILTKSGKNRGACVAAYDLDSCRFVRFVRDAVTGSEIPFHEIRDISVFDVVEADVECKCPVGPQTENLLVNQYGIRRIIRYSGTIEDLRRNIKYADNKSFMNTIDNRLFDVTQYHHSLEIISVSDLVLRKFVKYDQSITTRASFTFNGNVHLNYRVTDFQYDMRKFERDTLNIPYADLVVSIPVKDYIVNGVRKGYFKFVAAIFPIDQPTRVLDENNQKDCKEEFSTGRQRIRDRVFGSREQSYEPWSELEEAELLQEFENGKNIQELAIIHKRSYGAILSRLRKLGKIK